MLERHTIYSGAYRTSMRCEPELWQALQRIALNEGRTLTTLVTAVDRNRQGGESRTSALRAYVITKLLKYFPP